MLTNTEYYIASENCTESFPFKQVQSFSGHHTYLVKKPKNFVCSSSLLFFFYSLLFFFCLAFTWIREMLDGKKVMGVLPLCTFQTTFNGSRLEVSLHVRESEKFLLMETGIREKYACGIWNLGLWNPESGISITIGIQNPSSTDKYCNPAPGIRNPRRGIQSPGLVDYPRRDEK